MKKIISLILLFFVSFPAYAGGILDMDHELPLDESGIWNRNIQLGLEYGAAAAVVGGALWTGSDSRFGMTMWKSVDSMILANLASQVLKRTFRRQRPRTDNNPNAWFRTLDDESFPSGEVTHITSIVTPFIAEYGKDAPYVWALSLLPIYDGIARMKSHGHWQSDVLTAALLGASVGYYVNSRSDSFTVNFLAQGISVGIKKSF